MRKNSYHGGATLQEMIAIAVVSAECRLLVGRSAPLFIHSGGKNRSARRLRFQPRAPAAGRRLARAEDTLFEELGRHPPPTPAVPSWIDLLLRSEVFASQRRLAGRVAPPDEQFKSLLGALDERGGKLTRPALAHRLGPPMRVAFYCCGPPCLERRNMPSSDSTSLRHDRVEPRAASCAVRARIRRRQPSHAMISAERRNEVIDALRRGTVPQRSLDAFAVGLQPFEVVIGEELESVRRGRAQFKAVRGERQRQDVLRAVAAGAR